MLSPGLEPGYRILEILVLPLNYESTSFLKYSLGSAFGQVLRSVFLSAWGSRRRGGRSGFRCCGRFGPRQKNVFNLHFRVPLPVPLEAATVLATPEMLNIQLLGGVIYHLRHHA